jgi:hypothetical protein
LRLRPETGGIGGGRVGEVHYAAAHGVGDLEGRNGLRTADVADLYDPLAFVVHLLDEALEVTGVVSAFGESVGRLQGDLLGSGERSEEDGHAEQ